MHLTTLPTAASLVALLSLSTHAQGQTQQPFRDWDAAYAAAEELVSTWTIEQQANISVRYGVAPGFVPFEPTDGPTGISGGKGVSGWVSAQTLASSWNRSLAADQYRGMAVEARKKGFNMLLGPSTGPLGRSAFGGRLWEGLGSDPYLNGKLFAASIEAIQEEDVIASGKHYLANEQETNRTADDPEDRTNSVIDDRTLHELYLWPWIDGVNSGMGSAMCVMNRVNGLIGCENDHIMNGLLKNETNFQGFFVPDVTAPVNITRGLLAGLDWNSGYDLEEITAEITNGNIPESVITDHALRIVATQLNFIKPSDEYPSTDETELLNVRDPATKSWIRSAGAQSIVLLKNKNNTLPLTNPNSLALFGKSAGNINSGPSPKNNFNSFLGDTYPGHLATGGGSPAPLPYLVSPLDAITARAAEGEGFNVRYIISDNWTVTPPPSTGQGFFQSTEPSVSEYAEISEHCLVFLNAYAKEGADRRTLADEVGDKLVNDVASYCSSTIVVLNNAGVRLVDRWIENENVTAVLNAGALGQESGNAIADVLFGDVNPSGKLVYTIAKNESDYNGEICPVGDCEYTEGLYIDYRHFDQAGIEPRYEFGFGLSYTTFEYSNLTITPETDLTQLKTYADGDIVEGGPEDLFEDILTVTAEITNTGDVAGAEIAQLYFSLPEAANAPVRQLRGFDKVFLQPGETKAVTFPIQWRDLSIWDSEAQGWKVEGGEVGVFLGRSSRDFADEGSFTVETA
ncbi:glycoside hydrolase superfamily [Aspergillus karnatakaensis]|uniref:glycoside hydrolase superfamily n=1 Tax=Aspergillus karnatakaensis TaxID=1810916 RepID=UPI003CCCE31A